jgi:hypothetical protein
MIICMQEKKVTRHRQDCVVPTCRSRWQHTTAVALLTDPRPRAGMRRFLGLGRLSWGRAREP